MKGKVFTTPDLPKRLKARPEAMTKAWLKAQTERYAIVARDVTAPPGSQDLILEELDPRIIARLPEKARRLATLMLRMPVLDRVALLQAFDAAGRMKNPFTAV